MCTAGQLVPHLAWVRLCGTGSSTVSSVGPVMSRQRCRRLLTPSASLPHVPNETRKASPFVAIASTRLISARGGDFACTAIAPSSVRPRAFLVALTNPCRQRLFIRLAGCRHLAGVFAEETIVALSARRVVSRCLVGHALWMAEARGYLLAYPPPALAPPRVDAADAPGGRC